MLPVTIEFPNTLTEQVEGMTAVEIDQGFGVSDNSKPLAGNHLLVLATRRETRAIVRDAIRHMGLMVDFVTTIDEAREFCSGGMPHALLYETALNGDRFERLRKELLTDMPKLAFIELADDGQGLETRQVGQRRYSRVSLSTAIESLPPALMFELSRPR